MDRPVARMIHSVGDSHAQWSFRGIPGVAFHEIGPITMSAVGKQRKGASTSAIMLDNVIESLGITESDTIILCFGEIDTRCHVYPRVQAGENEDEVIEELVSDYFHTIQNSRFKNIWVLSITPSWARELWLAYLITQGRPEDNEAYPLRGGDVERARYTRKMNAWLRVECKRLNVPLVDVYDDYRDEAGMLIPALSDGSLHIGDNRFVRAALEKML